MRIDGLGLVLLLCAIPLSAQQLPLRYAPVPGFTLATVTDVNTLITVVGLPAVPDGAQFEESARRFARQRVQDEGPAGWLVEVRLDSVRARWRPVGAAWRDAAPSPLEGVAARARVTDRFEVTGVESSGEHDADILRALTGWTGGLGFAFPDAPVRVGIPFATGARIAFTAELTADSALPLREVVLGDLSLVLDSVVDRGTDSLAYFSFGGRFAPREVQTTGEAGAVQATLTGAYAGRLIWSTGWDAFVSGAVRLQVQARALAGGLNATVDWSTTVSHRVRP